MSLEVGSYVVTGHYLLAASGKNEPMVGDSFFYQQALTLQPRPSFEEGGVDLFLLSAVFRWFSPTVISEKIVLAYLSVLHGGAVALLTTVEVN